MLVNLKEILKIAEKNGTAIAAIDCPTFEMAVATIKAAEELNQPVILAHAQVHEEMGYMTLEHIAPIFKMLANQCHVPVCIHLDHGVSQDYVYKAIDLGFTSVMYDASLKSYEDNLNETKEVVAYAKKHDVSVEAELGSMPSNGGEDGKVFEPEDYYTKPEEAVAFIKETGIDALAVSYGSVHGIYKSEPKLNFDIVEQIYQSQKLPLVLHGGSGLSDDDYKKSIRAGIKKINYFTYMAYIGGEAVKKAISQSNDKFQYQDLVMVAIDAIKEDVKRIIQLFSNPKD